MKHLTDRDITNYFFGILPVEKSIKAGIHLDECFECFTKAEKLHSGIAVIGSKIDSLITLPGMIEAFRFNTENFVEQAEKDSLISLIQNHLNNAEDLLRSKLEEMLRYLRDPAFQLTPFISIMDQIVKQKSEVLVHNDNLILPIKELTIKGKRKGIIECRIETHEKELPIIFNPSAEKGIEILDLKNVAGTNVFSFAIPLNDSDKHFLLHKSKKMLK